MKTFTIEIYLHGEDQSDEPSKKRWVASIVDNRLNYKQHLYGKLFDPKVDSSGKELDAFLAFCATEMRSWISYHPLIHP